MPGNRFNLRFCFNWHFALLLIIYAIMRWYQRNLTGYTDQRSWYNKLFKILVFSLPILVCIRNYPNWWAPSHLKITYKTLWADPIISYILTRQVQYLSIGMKFVSLQCVPCNSLYRLKGTEYPKCLTNLFTAIWNFIAGQTISLIFIKA